MRILVSVNIFFVHFVVQLIDTCANIDQFEMQRIGSESLGYVRKMPQRCNEGSRGRYAAPPPVKFNMPARNEQASHVRGAEATKTVEVPNKHAIVEEPPSSGEAHLSESVTKEVSATKGRVDQISMKVSVLDSAVRATERSVIALREDLSSVSKNAGGQTSERVDALGKQMKTLEQSFCDFSTLNDRKHAHVVEEVACLRNAAIESTKCSTGTVTSETSKEIETLTTKVKEVQQQIEGLEAARSDERSQTTQLLLDWLQDNALPDLKRSIMDRKLCSEIAQGAAQLTYDKLREHVDTEMQQRDATLCAAIHRYSFPLEATVLRATNGHNVSQRVSLRHPVSQIEGTYYMQLLKRGANGAVLCELFPVMDSNGPLVAFVNEPGLQA